MSLPLLAQPLAARHASPPPVPPPMQHTLGAAQEAPAHERLPVPGVPLTAVPVSVPVSVPVPVPVLLLVRVPVPVPVPAPVPVPVPAGVSVAVPVPAPVPVAVAPGHAERDMHWNTLLPDVVTVQQTCVGVQVTPLHETPPAEVPVEVPVLEV